MPAGKMHLGEVDTDPVLVRRMLAMQFPQWADLPIEPVPSAGTDNALYRLGEHMTVRLPRIDWAIGQIDPYYLNTNPIGVANAQHMIGEILADYHAHNKSR